MAISHQAPTILFMFYSCHIAGLFGHIARLFGHIGRYYMQHEPTNNCL
jgi:hypothetical protein